MVSQESWFACSSVVVLVVLFLFLQIAIHSLIARSDCWLQFTFLEFLNGCKGFDTKELCSCSCRFCLNLLIEIHNVAFIKFPYMTIKLNRFYWSRLPSHKGNTNFKKKWVEQERVQQSSLK